MTKTRKQVREELQRKGIPLSAIARRHNFNANLLYAIINDDDANPKRKCRFGESHNIAVTLGLKEGELVRQPIAA
ncbi:MULTISPECIES: DNA-binding protein [Bordetella]|uniref:Phage-associated protein, BcepMu gp16 family n=1 Tax=Bordetella pseudohinzii TaxID=1331258 RepID=A0A0J6EXT1_9BORD|nr:MULTISPECIES: DNA-binding protein [Bordetella]ANY15920.1 hypothetical protein BBN53_08435 [Bordetella pseudohinzii]KDC65746.1 phage-associated protein, BcepMu gp16 family [Bordetella bronchiseptica MBORD591]KMM25160.1 hypothetical protein L540_02925 [Bordetella pseudohinzii]KXA75904.1 hypothetical protein AW877_18510 [Bordetella pseudohinzii]KXA78974.1 hypothetical protein AW878_11500 [Bordetella pseudohinzii]